jgi:predicted nucleic acid-binding protein
LTTIRFLDSGALVKLFIDEPGSNALRTYIDALDDNFKSFSLLGEVEVRSALQRRIRNHEMSPDQLRAALGKLHLVSTAWLRTPIEERVVELATGVITRYALRSLDALQLASTLALREQLGAGESILLIACDKRLLAAATAEGLTIWDPETSSIPPAPPVN